MVTIASQLESREKQLSHCEKELDRVQTSLRLGGLTEEHRTNLQDKERSLKREIHSHEKKMKELRKENWKSAVVSVILLGLIFILYKYLTTDS
ncbi:uncharacterized protein LOC135471839 [Liolophura sinensis]|uniref:uncharacterized protein LOC135471839 n=1 Tax=Liolophura sinensis TaxID=3198878 RepID=UPI0031591252